MATCQALCRMGADAAATWEGRRAAVPMEETPRGGRSLTEEQLSGGAVLPELQLLHLVSHCPERGCSRGTGRGGPACLDLPLKGGV